MRILGAHEGLLDAVVAVDVRAVDKTGNAVACGHIGGGGTNFVCQCDLVGDLGRILAVVALGAGIEAHRSQRLVGVLAGRNGLGVANGDLAVQIRDVGDGLDLGVGALSANEHKIVDEHILTRVGIDELDGLGVVHGALGSGDEHVDGGTGAHLLDKVAGGLKLRVGKGGAGLLGVKLLNLGQSLLERVGGKDLQLDSFLGRCLSRTGIGASRLRRLVARAAGKAKAGSGDSRERDESAARNHIEHVQPFRRLRPGARRELYSEIRLYFRANNISDKDFSSDNYLSPIVSGRFALSLHKKAERLAKSLRRR